MSEPLEGSEAGCSNGAPADLPASHRRTGRLVMGGAALLGLLALGLILGWPGPPRWRSGILHWVSYLVFMLRTFAPWLSLILIVPVVWAIWRRSWGVLVLAALPLLVIWIPELWYLLPRSPEPGSGPTLRILHFNLHYANQHHPEVADLIQSADPDIVMLHEYTPVLDDHLGPVLARRYPHHGRFPERGCFGAAIFSRWPLTEQVRNLAGDHPQRAILRAVVCFEDRPFALYSVHITPPVRSGFALQQAGWIQLEQAVRSETLPTIVGGDFNYTRRSRMHHLLLDAGLGDTQQMAGSGWGPTWPYGRGRRMLPKVRIDHIYVDSAFTCTNSATSDSAGSDHRPIVVDLAWRTPAEGGAS